MTDPRDDPMDDLTQLRTISFDDEIDRQPLGRPHLGRASNCHQDSARSNQACGAPSDVTTDHVEDQIHSADVFQRVVIEVDELLRAKVERVLPVGGTSGANDEGAGLSGQLCHHRSDSTGRTMHKDALPSLEAKEGSP